MFGVVLKGEHKGVNPADKVFNVGLIPPDIAASDVVVHLLPCQMQLLIARLNIVRARTSGSASVAQGAQRLLPALAMRRGRRCCVASRQPRR